MSEIYRMSEDRIPEFFDMIDWNFIKRVEITKTADGVIWAKLFHYRSGRYMLHALKYGWKNGNGVDH